MNTIIPTIAKPTTVSAHKPGRSMRPAKPESHASDEHDLTSPAHHFGNMPVYGSGGHGLLQAKSWISSPGDSHEEEADEMAGKVMRKAEPGVSARPESISPVAAGTGAGKGAAAPAIVNEALASSGRPLEGGTRSFFESRFGHDFGKVRIHTDQKAGESAKAVQAMAYTVGRDIVFGAGRYAPGTDSGKRLLAHELTHVVQQGGQAGAAHPGKEKGEDMTLSRQEEGQGDAKTAAKGEAKAGGGGDGNAKAAGQAEANASSEVSAVVAQPKRTPAEAALELLKRAHNYASSGNHDKAKELLGWVQQFINKYDTPANFDKQFQTASGMSKTYAQMLIGQARSAVHSLQAWYRIADKPSEGRWQYEVNSFGAAIPYLNVLTGTTPSQSSSVIQAVDKPMDTGSIYAELKERAYGALIRGLKTYKDQEMTQMRKVVSELPVAVQPVASGIVDAVGVATDLEIGLVLAVVGLVVGFAEGIVGTIAGIVKLAYGLLKMLGDAVLALAGHRENLDSDLQTIKHALDNFVPGLKKMIGDWWERYQKASPERQALMGGELVGEVEAFIATFAVAGAKAGDIPAITAKIPYPVINVSKAIVRTSTGLTQEVPVFAVTVQAAAVPVKVGAPAAAMAMVAPAVASVGGGGGGGGGPKRRPSWKNSEDTVGNHLGKSFEPQKGYRDGNLVKHDTFGRVVPDFYDKAANIAVEVKNYDLIKNIDDLISVLVEQGGGRMAYMPAGVKQWLFLDIRGQVITDLAGTAAKIQKATGGPSIFQRVYYITDTGIQRIL